MALGIDDSDRNVIPRWRQAQASSALGELSSLKGAPQRPRSTDTLASLTADWQANESLSFAADLVSGAFANSLRTKDVEEAARQILADESAPDTIRRIAAAVVGERPDQTSPNIKVLTRDAHFHHLIGALKRRAQIVPSNPIVWTDMARAYTALGQYERAAQMIRRSLALAADNRFILRAAARLFVHGDDLDRARHVLTATSAINEDPWVMAAEIAVCNAMGMSSNLLKKAQRMVDRGAFAPFHQSELCSALATAEAASSRRKATKLFKQSILNPTENSVAQLHWALRKHLVFGVSPDELERAHAATSPEASAWAMYHDRKWEEAAQAADVWLADQPFSKRPAIHGAFVAFVGLADPQRALEMTQIGLRASPNDFSLKNNVVFYSLQAGDLKGAEAFFSTLRISQLSDDVALVWQATRGLLEFRRGNAEAGRSYYVDAIASFVEKKDNHRAAMASIHLAMEECRIRSDFAPGFVEQVLRYVRDLKTPELEPLLGRLETAYKAYEPHSSKPGTTELSPLTRVLQVQPSEALGNVL